MRLLSQIFSRDRRSTVADYIIVLAAVGLAMMLVLPNIGLFWR